jgi:pyruvate/2-oxoglutarate dehydrogenase complex dihydrolipoamide acyltransferase (E2) component
MTVKVIVPQIGQSIAEATIVKWFKQPGDAVEKGEILVEIGTDKINTEIPAPESGVIERLLAQEGEIVPVQTEIALIQTEKIAEPVAPPAQRHSPLVRRLAEEHNIDLAKVSGTGEGGRITKDDLQKWIDSKAAQSDAEIVPMPRMRKLIAEHMMESKRSTADLTTIFEIDMTQVVHEREQARASLLQDHGLKLTYLPFVIAAAAKALRAYPIVNSSIEGENIRYKKDCNIGIATAVEEGLLVPVIRKADQMSVLALARAASDFAERARTRRLTAEDMMDGTFTITNPGVFGALMGTPIINYPQVAILGMGAVEKRVVAIHDQIQIRPMAYFSLTYDHRAMDGAIADSFMAHIKRTLETECPKALE